MADKDPPKVTVFTSISNLLKERVRVQILLVENAYRRIEGYIVGFDESINLVLDDAEEYNIMFMNRRKIGRIVLRGHNIVLIRTLTPLQEE